MRFLMIIYESFEKITWTKTDFFIQLLMLKTEINV